MGQHLIIIILGDEHRLMHGKRCNWQHQNKQLHFKHSNVLLVRMETDTDDKKNFPITEKSCFLMGPQESILREQRAVHSCRKKCLPAGANSRTKGRAGISSLFPCNLLPISFRRFCEESDFRTDFFISVRKGDYALCITATALCNNNDRIINEPTKLAWVAFELSLLIFFFNFSFFQFSCEGGFLS